MNPLVILEWTGVIFLVLFLTVLLFAVVKNIVRPVREQPEVTTPQVEPPVHPSLAGLQALITAAESVQKREGK